VSYSSAGQWGQGEAEKTYCVRVPFNFTVNGDGGAKEGQSLNPEKTNVEEGDKGGRGEGRSGGNLKCWTLDVATRTAYRRGRNTGRSS
jgi:hypothetical protein